MCKGCEIIGNLFIMKESIVFIICAFLIISCRSNDYPGGNTQIEHELMINKFNMLQGNVFLQYQSENVLINNFHCENIMGNKESIKYYLSDKPKLFFRFSEYHCNTCVERALDVLLNNIDSIGRSNVIILSSYKSIRVLRAYLKQQNIDLLILNAENIELPIEKFDTPYFFLMSSSMKTECLFIPIKEIPNYSQTYIEIISRKVK